MFFFGVIKFDVLFYKFCFLVMVWCFYELGVKEFNGYFFYVFGDSEYVVVGGWFEC